MSWNLPLLASAGPRLGFWTWGKAICQLVGTCPFPSYCFLDSIWGFWTWGKAVLGRVRSRVFTILFLRIRHTHQCLDSEAHQVSPLVAWKGVCVQIRGHPNDGCPLNFPQNPHLLSEYLKRSKGLPKECEVHELRQSEPVPKNGHRLKKESADEVHGELAEVHPSAYENCERV